MRGLLRLVLYSGWLAVSVLVSVLSGRWWVGILVALGLLFLNNGYELVGPSMDETAGLTGARRFRFHAGVGLALLVAAAVLAELDGRWLWTGIFLLAAFPLLFAAVGGRRVVSRIQTITMFAMCIALIGAAVAAPYLRHGLWNAPSFYPWILAWSSLLLSGILLLQVKAQGSRSRWAVVLAVALVVIFGLVAGGSTSNPVVGVLVSAGLYALYRNTGVGLAGIVFAYKRYGLEALLGLGLLTAAAALDRMSVGWLWSVLWGVATIPLIGLCQATYPMESDDRARADTSLVFSLVCLSGSLIVALVALTGPWLLVYMPVSRALAVFAALSAGYLLVTAGWSGGWGGAGARLVLLGGLGVIATGGAWVLSGEEGTAIWRVLWAGVALLLGSAAARSGRSWSRITGSLLALVALAAAVLGRARMETPTAGLGDVWMLVLISVGGLVVLSAIGVLVWLRLRVRSAARQAASSPSHLTSPESLRFLMSLLEDEDR